MSDVFLGIDLGTSGLKVSAVHEDGKILAEAEQSYQVDRPLPGHAEISPEVWVRSLHAAVARLGSLKYRSAGIDGQMHGVVLVDADGIPCRPAILWPDRRAESELPRWRDLSAQQRTRLANPLTAGMAGPMLGWIQHHEPVTVQAASAAVQPKDFLRGSLGGQMVGERSDASATLLWDVPADTWATDVIEELGLPGHLLPEVVPSHEVVGAADLPGEPALVAGAGDTPAALLGSGGLAVGEVQVNLGTGAQILVGVDAPRPSADPKTHLYADAGSAWYGMVAIQNGGLALNKAREWLQMSWDQLFAAAAAVPAGAGGVSVIPYLTGERGGVAAPTSRGSWLGLTDTTTAADIARAAVEAMVFAVRQGVELLGSAPQSVRVTGGGARNPLVPQMLADSLTSQVDVLPDRSASSLGAAMLAATGVGAQIAPVRDRPLTFTPRASGRLEESYQRWATRLVAAGL
ncbi:MAG: FGGY family carbohydrate kinase [Candidatus Nanopelagicales bacterium]